MVLQVVADRDNASSPRVGTSKLDTQGTKRAQEHYKFIQHMNIYVLTQSLYSPQFFSLRNSPSTRIQNIPGGQLLNYADQKTASSASSSHFHADLQHHNHHQSCIQIAGSEIAATTGKHGVLNFSKARCIWMHQ
ncbi:Os03g0165050 [Oryza sativa Japonica Group]|jgi:hypothetical protein|uniref:Os03g0165050 protein n=1 Tax=Oryza sativa subsp. japonica TaxID=39947 RepID=A0A0P0VTE0_ORYSJ|nr:hypothetical protein EE612_015505 [Oryza sativa]BAS82460.1 Os03g0165050 [Oryza sativa Japonica Group]